jgi:hypothetical protein
MHSEIQFKNKEFRQELVKHYFPIPFTFIPRYPLGLLSLYFIMFVKILSLNHRDYAESIELKLKTSQFAMFPAVQ